MMKDSYRENLVHSGSSFEIHSNNALLPEESSGHLRSHRVVKNSDVKHAMRPAYDEGQLLGEPHAVWNPLRRSKTIYVKEIFKAPVLLNI